MTSIAIIDANGFTRLAGTNPDGGGSQPGATIVRAFPFAFNTVGLLTGATLYTPTVGDVILDMWLGITTAWDGTTPRGDVFGFGGSSGQHFGYLQNLTGDTLDMTVADTADNSGNVWFSGQLSELRHAEILTWPTGNEGDGLYAVAGAAVNFVPTPISSGTRQFPAKVRTAGALKFVVSQDGKDNGASPGSAAGAATLYIVTATPA